MAKWFDQAREIDRLRDENKRQMDLISQLQALLGDDARELNIYGVSAEERALVEDGHPV